MFMSNLRQVEYRDLEGRLSARLIPAFASDNEAISGIVLGPPPLTALNLPLALEVRLNNEFYHRGLLTEADIAHRRGDAVAALMSALRVDIDLLLMSLREGSYAVTVG